MISAVRGGFAVLALVLGLAAVAPMARAQTQWVEYFVYGSDHFYYAPSSVSRNGNVGQVQWTNTTLLSSGGQKVLMTVEANCSARTLQTITATGYDAQTNQLIQVQDLRSGSQPDAVGGVMGSRLFGYVCG